MSGAITFNWPDADLEKLEAARGRLEVAAEQMRGRPRAEIVRALGAVLEHWRDPDSDSRRRILDEHPDAAGPGRALFAAGLDLGLGPWTAQALEGVVADELGLEDERRSRISPFDCTSVLLAGSIPMPNILQTLLPLILRSPVLVRSGSRDPVSARLLKASLEAVDEMLARCIEIVGFASHDEASLRRFLASECVVASGSDQTIGALRSAMGAGRLVAYGHKLSVAAFGRGAFEGAAADAACDALARDVALWNQGGCLSPIALYCVGGDAAVAEALGERLSHALETLEQVWPRGEVDPRIGADIAAERAEAELRAAASGSGRVFASTGTTHTVVVEPEPALRRSPLWRFIRVHALPDVLALREVLAPHARHVSCAALAGFAGEEEALAIELFTSLGASRLCRPGRMQAPPISWRHDGRPILIPLCRFVDFELD